MADLTRRNFLGLFGAAAAVAVVGMPAIASEIPVIMGDGVHDDTAGLRAFMLRQPVRVIDDAVEYFNGSILLKGGKTYKISDTVTVPEGVRLRGKGPKYPLFMMADNFPREKCAIWLSVRLRTG